MNLITGSYMAVPSATFRAMAHGDPYPVKAFISPEQGIEAADWILVTTLGGTVTAMAEIRDDMPAGLVRVPHGWWKPETAQGAALLSGAMLYSDSLVTIDHPDFRDAEQGIPHLRGIPCSVRIRNST